jgi:hypothetical protein
VPLESVVAEPLAGMTSRVREPGCVQHHQVAGLELDRVLGVVGVLGHADERAVGWCSSIARFRVRGVGARRRRVLATVRPSIAWSSTVSTTTRTKAVEANSVSTSSIE